MLNAKRLALAGGILWGVFVFIFTYLNMFFDYGSMWIGLLADVYPFYDATVLGSFLGLIYGFFDAAIGLYLLAWLYNKLSV